MGKKSLHTAQNITTKGNKIMLHILNCEFSHEMYMKLCAFFERDAEQQKFNLLQDYFQQQF